MDSLTRAILKFEEHAVACAALSFCYGAGMAAGASPDLSAYRTLLSTYLRPQGGRLVWLAGLLMCGIAVQVASPLLLGRFVDDALSGAAQDRLLVIGSAFLLGSILQQSMLVGATYVSEQVAWSATNTLREHLTLHCLSLDASFHERHTPGELIERVDGDVTAVASFFSQFVIQVLGNALLLIGILVITCIYDARIGAILTASAAVAFVLMLKTRAVAVPFWVQFREAGARLYGFIEEHLNGLEDVRTAGAEAYALRIFGDHAWARVRAARTARLFSGIAWSMPILLSATGTACVFALTAWLVGAGALTIGTAFTLYFYVQLLVIPLNSISNQLEEFQRASAGIVRIQEVRAWRSALNDADEPLPIPEGALSVEFDRVDFAYRADEPVLRNVSFTLPAGATLGLVGRTGSGKSTIIRLLTRLWDVNAGCVRLGGVDVRRVHRPELRARISVVSQQPQLFRASMRDNLTLFDRSISEQRMFAALDELGIGDWVRGLAEGMDTVIGPGGRGLSAGEAQLLGLARSFLHDPGVVILDEPSSRLDTATEQLVTAAIARLLMGRTGLIVAHRLETLDQVDEILVLEDGRIAEFGVPV